jgi:hypothetical protein
VRRSASLSSSGVVARDPYGVDDAVDWPKNIVADRRDPQSNLADSSELLEQPLAVEKPWIG